MRIEGPTAIVRVADQDRRAAIRGQLKAEPRRSTHPIACGDEVDLETDASGSAAVARVHPRRNELARVDPGDPLRCSVIAANVDRLVCIQSFRDPPLNLRALDRFLLLAHAAGIPAVVVVNKSDLHPAPPPAELLHLSTIGLKTLFTSARTGAGVPEFRETLERGRTVLVGPSGVGKSSLLNAAVPGLRLRTGSISRATQKGTHTTVRVEWIDLEEGGGGAVVLDTPGLRAVQPWGIAPEDLTDGFPEFRPHRDCRFSDCLHVAREGCAVQRAVERGRIPAWRYDSYLRILVSLREEEEARTQAARRRTRR